jgi:hypothetical protein
MPRFSTTPGYPEVQSGRKGNAQASLIIIHVSFSKVGMTTHRALFATLDRVQFHSGAEFRPIQHSMRCSVMLIIRPDGTGAKNYDQIFHQGKP